MTTMALRASVVHELELIKRRHERVIRALPTVETIQVDEELIHAASPNLDGLCYAFFPGKEHAAPCALLAISLDPDRLPTTRWQVAPVVTSSRLDTVMAAALLQAADLLGRTKAAGVLMTKTLRPFGIYRSGKTYTRVREQSPTAEQARVATAIARCLVHLMTPCKSPEIEAIHYPLLPASAQPIRDTRPPVRYRNGHERELRLCA